MISPTKVQAPTMVSNGPSAPVQSVVINGTNVNITNINGDFIDCIPATASGKVLTQSIDVEMPSKMENEK